jgi:NAD(P)H-dependent FMN reductase
VGKKVVAIVGCYRKGGTTDTAVEAILEGAREKGAETHTIYLILEHLEFCTNCRRCTQEPGAERGKCPHQDNLEPILAEIEAADAVVIGSPVNQGNITAISRLFLERLGGFLYWPWGQAAPVARSKQARRKAALVSSCAMPGMLLPLVTGAPWALRKTAQLLGAKPVGHLWIGSAAQRQHDPLSERNLKRARELGRKLA